MLAVRLRPIIEPLTTAAGRALARTHVSPNALTAIGLLGTLACAWIVAAGRPVLGGALLIAPMLVDVLDGATARATGKVTVRGAYWDSVADRLSDGALLGAIAWSARETDARLLAASLVAMVLTFCVPYARAKAEALDLKTVPGPGERAERAVLLIAGLLFGILEPMVWVIVALTSWTLVTRSVAVWRQTPAS